MVSRSGELGGGLPRVHALLRRPGVVPVTGFDAGAEPVPGVPFSLAPGVVRVTAPNPSLMTGAGTNTYLIGVLPGAGTESAPPCPGGVVIDPGPADPAHLDALMAVLASPGAAPVASVIVTHTHPDHAPLARELARRTGARLMGFEPGPEFEPDLRVVDGDVIGAGQWRLRAIHTPGHASDHLCYLMEETGWLFAGDQLMEGSTVVIAPPDGDMAAYLASLERLASLEPPIAAVAPAHGRVMSEPGQVIQGYLAHRRMREAAILDALGKREAATIEELVESIYIDIDPALHPIARYSVWAHLRKLAADGLVRRDPGEELSSLWRTS